MKTPRRALFINREESGSVVDIRTLNTRLKFGSAEPGGKVFHMRAPRPGGMRPGGGVRG